MQSKLSHAVDEVRNHLIVISLMKQQVHFIDLFGWSFVIGELSTQKLLKSLL